MKRVGVVICNYNKSTDVLNCIDTVLESKYTDYDLYVVDNASTDDSVEQIRKKYHNNELTLIVNERNLGGSGGFNAGLRRAAADGHEYLYCLDNDVLIDENAMGELVLFLDTHPDCGMVGSRVYHMDYPGIIQQFGQIVDFEEYSTEAKYLGKTDEDDVPDIEYSDAVAACSLLVRKSLTDIIGFMPEDNFLYWDDTEWGYLCNRAGFRVASVGSSVVLHRMGAKKEIENTFPTYYAWRNWIRFFIKYTPEDKLEDMCDTFLKCVFDIQFEGFYRGEYNRAKTVMYAYDDAIHNVRGEAREGRIFQLDRSDEKLLRLLRGKRTVKIVKGRAEDFSALLKAKILQFNAQIEFVQEIDQSADLTLYMCNSICNVNDMSLTRIYVDSQLNVFENQEDALKIINYSYSLEVFRFANKPLFLKCVHEIRGHETVDLEESKGHKLA